MAKTLLALVLIAGAAYFVWTRVGRTPSEEAAMVTELRERYNVAVNKFLSAIGRAGVIGMEASFDSETPAAEIRKIQTELARLRRTLTEPRAIGRADKLAEKIGRFCERNRINRP